jgi:hypothetical protein
MTARLPFRAPTLLAVTLVGGALLRCWGLGDRCLWFDEALTWRFLDLTPAQMMEGALGAGGSHPPVYYLVLRAWAGVWGHSEVALRSLAVLAGVLTIAGTYLFMKEAALLGRATAGDEGRRRAEQVACLAAALVAGSVAQVHASQQARMYSLGTALLTLDSWLLLRALRGRPYRRVSWVLFGVLAVLFCYTHLLGLFALAAQGIFAALYLTVGPGRRHGAAGEREGGAQLRWALGVAAAVAVACSPLPAMALAKADGMGWSVPLHGEAIAYETALALLSTFAAPFAIPPAAAWCLTAALLGTLVYLALRQGWPGRFVALGGLLPAQMMIVYSLTSGRSLFLCRYLTFIQVYWLCAIALFAFSLRPAARWALLAGLAAVWLLVSYPAGRQAVGPADTPGMRAAVEHVLRHRQPGEALLAQRPITLIKALYYLRGRARPRLCVPIPSRLLQPQAAWLNDDDLVPTADVLSLEARGVWVLSTSWYDEAPEVTFPLPGHWQLERTFRFAQDYPGEGPVMVYYYRATS